LGGRPLRVRIQQPHAAPLGQSARQEHGTGGLGGPALGVRHNDSHTRTRYNPHYRRRALPQTVFTALPGYRGMAARPPRQPNTAMGWSTAHASLKLQLQHLKLGHRACIIICMDRQIENELVLLRARKKRLAHELKHLDAELGRVAARALDSSEYVTKSSIGRL